MKFFAQSNTSKLSKEKFESVYKTFYNKLFYYCFQFISDEEIAKDIVNDVFEKIWLRREKLKDDTLTIYLYTLVKNKCLDYLKHKKIEVQYIELHELYAIHEPEDDDMYEYRISQIDKIISNLEEPTKGIFSRCYFLNKKYSEVADEYKISTSTVKKHIMKVLRLIREEFNIKK